MSFTDFEDSLEPRPLREHDSENEETLQPPTPTSPKAYWTTLYTPSSPSPIEFERPPATILLLIPRSILQPLLRQLSAAAEAQKDCLE